MADERLYATFFVHDSYYGIDALDVQEFLRSQPMTRAPLCPPDVAGLINLRGQIVTAIDLRVRLGLPPSERGFEPMNVVVRTDDGPVSLLVDEIGDAIELPDASLEPIPTTVNERERGSLLGVHTLDGRLLLVLDVASVTSPSLDVSST
jgi:purine-binding chemotaxis protein CheW